MSRAIKTHEILSDQFNQCGIIPATFLKLSMLKFQHRVVEYLNSERILISFKEEQNDDD